MKCPNCGEEIAKDSVFCEFCGTKISNEEENTRIDKKRKKKIIVISAICALIFVIILVIFSSGDSGERTQVEPIPGYPMVWVEGGKFIRGDVAAQIDDDNYTTNTDSIEVSGFYMGICEVNQSVWEQVMGSNNPSFYDSDKRNPVENVSYADVCRFIDKANAMYASKLQRKKLALPTEAEWEYAAGGGNKAKRKAIYSGGPLESNSWYFDNSHNQTHPVGSLQPNRLGIFDMTGNVSELCQDHYSENFYQISTKRNPLNTINADYGHVIRGGSFHDDKESDALKISYRDFQEDTQSTQTVGFRLVLK